MNSIIPVRSGATRYHLSGRLPNEARFSRLSAPIWPVETASGISAIGPSRAKASDFAGPLAVIGRAPPALVLPLSSLMSTAMAGLTSFFPPRSSGRKASATRFCETRAAASSRMLPRHPAFRRTGPAWRGCQRF